MRTQTAFCLSLPLFFFFFLSFLLSFFLAFFLSFFLSFFLCLFQSLFFLSLLCVSFYRAFHPLFICLFVCLFVHLFVFCLTSSTAFGMVSEASILVFRAGAGVEIERSVGKYENEITKHKARSGPSEIDTQTRRRLIPITCYGKGKKKY